MPIYFDNLPPKRQPLCRKRLNMHQITHQTFCHNLVVINNCDQVREMLAAVDGDYPRTDPGPKFHAAAREIDAPGKS